MVVKQLIDEDFVNYKKAAMLIGFPICSFKCDKECGMSVCHNSILASAPNINIEFEDIVTRYKGNDFTSAIVFQGMEPFDSWDDLFQLIKTFRIDYAIQDDIVIYTGYYKREISKQLEMLKQFNNIIVKFGRFIPNRPHKYDDVLGIELASDNQYGAIIC